jgi:tetratricopeptide (TPR) repeat protein
MSQKGRTVPAASVQKAKALNLRGLQQYERWEIEEAIKSFEAAIVVMPEEPEYYLNLARALARFGDLDAAMRSLGSYIRYEPDTGLAERFEALFSNSMDDVERLLTRKMTDEGVPLDVIGAGVQMWLEYRICLGRRPLVIRKPETWAASLDYTVRKVNFRELTQKEVADMYRVSPSTVRAYHNDLIQTLDIMPCDYRYFRGDENPLDKLVEAAAMLEELEERFRQP